MEELLTPDTVATVLGKSRLTIIRWLRAGVLKGFKVGRAWRVRPEDLDAFIKTLADRQENN
mgnify:CR=1 FL=1